NVCIEKAPAGSQVLVLADDPSQRVVADGETRRHASNRPTHRRCMRQLCDAECLQRYGRKAVGLIFVGAIGDPNMIGKKSSIRSPFSICCSRSLTKTDGSLFRENADGAGACRE